MWSTSFPEALEALENNTIGDNLLWKVGMSDFEKCDEYNPSS
jgi:hypothetical protein